MTIDFWEAIDNYKALGLNPIVWVPTGSNEVNSLTSQKILFKLKRTSTKMAYNWYDYYYYIDGKDPELTRRVHSLDNLSTDKDVPLKHALLLFNLQSDISNDIDASSETIHLFLKNLHARVTARKITISKIADRKSQFALFDYIQIHRGEKAGYSPASNAAMQVTDITQNPDSEVHCAIAMTAAIENLVLLGCTSGFKLFPVYDAPSEEMIDIIRRNLDIFSSKYNLGMEDYSSLKIGKLFYGCTAIANTTKELPTRYNEIAEGMEIILTRKFGSGTPLCLHILSRMDQNLQILFKNNNINPDELAVTYENLIRRLCEPQLGLGKIISKYCPDFQSPFDARNHIAAVYPASVEGILSVARLAGALNSEIVINDIHIENEELCKFATREFLIEDSTYSINGTHLIVAHRDITKLIIEELKKQNFDPSIIGFIAKRGQGKVSIQQDIRNFVVSKSTLDVLENLGK